jgi:hypothetical protein
MAAGERVRRVALVRVDDPAYVEAMSQAAADHRRLGPRQDPGDLYRASHHVEAAVRGWLGARLPLLDERVIDAELLPVGGRSYERRFIELDAVVGRDGEPVRLVEVKFSAGAGAVRRGLSQLVRARDLLRHRWPGLGRLLILVEANRTGVALDPDRLRDVTVIAPDALAEPAHLAPVALLVLTAADLRTHLDAEARALVERGHDEGDALTAARLARAMALEAAAGGATDWPAVAAAEPRQDGPSVRFGDEPDDEADSPFAALAGLRLAEEVDDERSGASGAEPATRGPGA